MNRYIDRVRTSLQKLNFFSGRGFINFAFNCLFLCSLSLISNAQQSPQGSLYLDHRLLISRHYTDTSAGFSTQSTSFENTSLPGFEDYGMEFMSYTLEDADPYYFAFDSNNCHIDPFTSSEDGSENKQILASCLKSRLWTNDNIPLWIRATGVTVLIGAAGSAGKVDDDLKFTMSFDKMDSILRDWLSNKNQ